MYRSQRIPGPSASGSVGVSIFQWLKYLKIQVVEVNSAGQL